MDRRSLCCFIICIVLFWLHSVHQPKTTDDAGAVNSVGLQIQTQPSANGSKPNQIHDPSRSQQLSSNLSSYTYYYYSLSLDKAATLAPTPTAASRPLAPQLLSFPSGASSSLSSDLSESSQLIDLHNFAYHMRQPGCAAHVQVLILVHTAPWNSDKRNLIRRTWGEPHMKSAQTPLRIVFLLGAVSPERGRLQRALNWENYRHADLVQGNFLDAYRNMTYKHVMALKWFSDHCAHAQLLIKVDDDVYVNTPHLIKLLREPANTNLTTEPTLHSLIQQRRDLLFCRPVERSRAKRTYRSKWRVSFREYSSHYYPPYCPGFAIVYSADVVQRLYKAAQHAGYFWVDDVLITGVLAQQTNTTITTLKPYVLYKRDCERLLRGELDLEQKVFLFTWHSIEPEQISALWQLNKAHNYTLTQRSNQLEGEPEANSGRLETGLS